jgi:hypothetical protein
MGETGRWEMGETGRRETGDGRLETGDGRWSRDVERGIGVK